MTRSEAIDRAITEGNKPDGERVEWMDEAGLEGQGRRLLREDSDDRGER